MQEALDDEAAEALLADRLPGLPGEVAVALIRLAGGDPAVLLEIAGALTPEQIRGTVPPPCTLSTTSALGRSCRAVVARLPRRTRHALLLAAADADLTPGELLAAAGADDLAVAEQACLITITADTVQFVPAVLRAVIYYDAPLAARRAAHRELTVVLTGRGERLRGLVHRAAAAPGADDGLAAELLDAAADGPPPTATAAYRYAAGLCTEPDMAADALVASARQAWLAGERHQARLLLRRVARRTAFRAHARARHLTGEMDLREGDPVVARDTLLDAAARLATHDVPAALDALLLAGEAVHLAGEHGRYPEVARQTLALCRGDEPVAVALAYHQVAGLSGLYAGEHAAAFGHLRTVLRLATRVEDPAALIRAAHAGVFVGDGPGARTLAGRAVALARQRGEVALVPQGLEVAAFAGLATGHYEAATTAATEGAALARATGQPGLAESHLGILAVLAALVGDRDTCVLRVREADAHDSAEGPGQARALCEWALALLDLVEGRPQATVDRLGTIFLAPSGHGNLVVQIASTPHLIEADWRCDPRTATLDGAFEPFDRWAAGTGQPSWLALRARCRALRSADPQAAEDHFEEALRQHRRGDADFARAHTELLFGRDLRRRRRPGAAREHLRRAEETFRLLDAGPWAVQADVELRAAGAAVPSRPVPAAPGLTAQQERIARLVADGATNREVAEQLFLSPRTIDHHLRNVFARMGVRSRTELARRLAS
ncbi:helix-turn-helix transcriptional regulator [Actinoplanes friuliensis]|uniref:Putative LuxR-family transcriptional regulator n=1 Tax=Actinoplanes friuliensis DSM 7358 TaxID=1246995 RepID=U5W3P0_9ACTN|nr:LuxR family transcriptional regulator [Actinoplanes friuliensis]AGZ43749.1 putative LuxR-family transcriptional regulator [Actinoplanes friuliensis DSM 7358]